MSDWINRFSLKGKNALVTGASSGIGASIAKVFADAGANIVGQGRDKNRLHQTGECVEKLGTKFQPVFGDLSLPNEVEHIAISAVKAFGQIDILVNSAGIAITDPVVEISLNDWHKTLAVNLTAPFLLCKALLPQMTKRESGKIINISSQTGVIALENHTAYATSKGGLNALTKSLMVEAAPHNVQVNAICPTVVLTEMGTELWSAPEKNEPFIARTPLGRFGQPVEIADMALYLASSASDLVNGEIMMIEGGYSSI